MANGTTKKDIDELKTKWVRGWESFAESIVSYVDSPKMDVDVSCLRADITNLAGQLFTIQNQLKDAPASSDQNGDENTFTVSNTKITERPDVPVLQMGDMIYLKDKLPAIHHGQNWDLNAVRQVWRRVSHEANNEHMHTMTHKLIWKRDQI